RRRGRGVSPELHLADVLPHQGVPRPGHPRVPAGVPERVRDLPAPRVRGRSGRDFCHAGHRRLRRGDVHHGQCGRVLLNGAWVRVVGHWSDPLYRQSYLMLASTGVSAGTGLLFWVMAALMVRPEALGAAAGLVAANSSLSYLTSLVL